MRKLIYIAILTAIALVISLFESVIPLPFLVPGAKLGLSNIVVLVTLVVFGFKEAMAVGILKSFSLMLVSGSVTSMLYSMAGSIGSILVMFIAYKYFSKYLSLIGVSILGSTMHNACQITVAAILTQSLLIYTYLPMLILVGLFTGFFVGLASIYVSRHLIKLGIGDSIG